MRIHIRLYPGQDDDLIAWWRGLEGLPFGAKSQAVREALRRGIGGAGDPRPVAVAPIDLGAIRQVVEAAVSQALAGVHRAPVSGEGEDDDDDFLRRLGEALILEE